MSRNDNNQLGTVIVGMNQDQMTPAVVQGIADSLSTLHDKSGVNALYVDVNFMKMAKDSGVSLQPLQDAADKAGIEVHSAGIIGTVESDGSVLASYPGAEAMMETQGGLDAPAATGNHVVLADPTSAQVLASDLGKLNSSAVVVNPDQFSQAVASLNSGPQVSATIAPLAMKTAP